MPTLSEMFPNLAKLSKDGDSASKPAKAPKRAKTPKAAKPTKPPKERKQGRRRSSETQAAPGLEAASGSQAASSSKDNAVLDDAPLTRRLPERRRGASQQSSGADFSLTMNKKPLGGGAKRELRRPLAGRGGAPRLRSFGSLKDLSIGRGGGRGSASLVGLDIQPGYVTAVEAEVNGVVAVKRAVGMALPAETMREGEVTDEALLAEVLKELFGKSRLSRRVRIGLANQRTVVRTMDLPPIDDRKELAAAVSFQAQDQIPMPLASAVLDFQPLGIVQTPAGRRQRVVVVAAQREMVQRLVGSVSAAGLRPEAVDLSAFAMIRALHRPEEMETEAEESEAPLHDEREQEIAAGAAHGEARGGGAASQAGTGAGTGPGTRGSGGAGVGAIGAGASPGTGDMEAFGEQGLRGPRTLYLNVGGLTNLAIAEGVTCRFTRAVGGGLESMAAALAERRSVPLAEARASIAELDLAKREQQSELPMEPTANDPAVQAGEVRTVITGGLREIAGEVRNSLDFHRAQESGGGVDKVVVSGAALEINGFAGALEAELGFPVQRRTVARARGGELDGVPTERLTVAAGLAVEEVAP